MAKIKGMYQRGRMWWLRYTPGKGQPQQRIPLGTHIEQLATIEALQILNSAPVDATGEFELAFDEYFSEQVRKSMLSADGARNRRWVLKTFADLFGVSSINTLTVDKVERWVDWLKGGKGGEGVPAREPIADGTAQSYLGYLRAFCGWLVKKQRLRKNIAAEVELGKVEMVVAKTWVPGETVRKLIAEAPDDDMRFILYCGFHAGMRKLEIVEARPSFFRLGSGTRRGVINVHRTKTFKCKDRDERIVPLSREFETFLRSYLARLPEDAEYVLRPRKNKKGKHRYRYDFRKPFTTFMKSHGLGDVTPHDMRRTFVSLKLIEDSSLIFKVAKWIGDGVAVVERHYAHLLADDEDIETGLQPVKSEELT